jgi:hypothetical protein
MRRVRYGSEAIAGWGGGGSKFPVLVTKVPHVSSNTSIKKIDAMSTP